MSSWFLGVAAVLAAQGAMPMGGDAPAKPCMAVSPPPAGMAGWARMTPATAGATAAAAPLLALGAGTQAALLPTPQVAYPLRPEKPGAAESHGGLFAFTAPAAGRYRVALAAGAWVDVAQGGEAAVSVAHGHGPDCSGIRKMVDFDLQPGRYLLQIAGSGGATLPLMVVKLP